MSTPPEVADDELMAQMGGSEGVEHIPHEFGVDSLPVVETPSLSAAFLGGAGHGPPAAPRVGLSRSRGGQGGARGGVASRGGHGRGSRGAGRGVGVRSAGGATQGAADALGLGGLGAAPLGGAGLAAAPLGAAGLGAAGATRTNKGGTSGHARISNLPKSV
jgi:hypothetical protein